MEGYRDDTYGERLADVYDEWYRGVDVVDDIVSLVERSAPASVPLRILELAVGTGRLAIPLAGRGHAVTGVDVSPAMLRRLAAADPEGTVTAIVGDMVDDLPAGPFDVVLVAYNSLFMLTDRDRQAACFAAVAARLAPEGAFVVDAFVPEEPPRTSPDISLRSMTADCVVLSISTIDAASQRVDGQLVELTDGAPVRLRPYSLRYSTPAELDAFAAMAGLRLAARHQDAAGTPFDDYSSRHVSVYLLTNATIAGP